MPSIVASSAQTRHCSPATELGTVIGDSIVLTRDSVSDVSTGIGTPDG